MSFFILLLFSCPSENISFSAGVSTFPGTLIGYEIGASYNVGINERLTASSFMGFTKSKYDSSLGTKSLDCEFSRLFIRQSIEHKMPGGLFLLYGVAIHTLKNWVTETNRIGSWKITDYYALNDIAPGITAGAGLSFGRGSLGIIYDFIFINDRGENIFYRRGNLHSLSLRLAISLMFGE
jgi:hypothetical protein